MDEDGDVDDDDDSQSSDSESEQHVPHILAPLSPASIVSTLQADCPVPAEPLGHIVPGVDRGHLCAHHHRLLGLTGGGRWCAARPFWWRGCSGRRRRPRLPAMPAVGMQGVQEEDRHRGPQESRHPPGAAAPTEGNACVHRRATLASDVPFSKKCQPNSARPAGE